MTGPAGCRHSLEKIMAKKDESLKKDSGVKKPAETARGGKAERPTVKKSTKAATPARGKHVTKGPRHPDY